MTNLDPQYTPQSPQISSVGKLLVSLVDAGLVEACDDGQEWTRDCYRPTDAGREAAR